MAYPAGPGFGSIQNAPATGVNPTAFPTAPPSVGGGGIAPGGLGNMVGVNLQQPSAAASQGSAPQPFRAPLPMPPPPVAAGPAAPQNTSNPFANVQIPQGQNTAVAQPFGGLDRTQWNALTPQQRGAAQGPMGEYQAGLGMMPSGNNFVASANNPSGSNPQASNALAWMGKGGADWNQMMQQPSLFGLGG